jgi:hypothetical protein
MNKLRKLVMCAVICVIAMATGQAQYNSWAGQPFEEEASDYHSIYRQALKGEDWTIAEENWRKAYEMAPLADGKRDYHFIDGAKIYVHKFKTETDPAKKAENKAMVYKLYDQAVEAYEKRLIESSKCTGPDDNACYDALVGYVYTRKGFDMFYSLNEKYSENIAVYDLALEKSGNDIEYTFFDPLSAMVVYQFQKGLMDKEKVLEYFKRMEEIAAYNEENNQRLGQYYGQAWAAAKAKFGPIETDIFDCDYFKPSYMDMYQSDPNDMDQLKNIIGLLKKRNCDPSDPFLVELEGKWKTYASAENAKMKAEFEANNPGMMAKKMYDQGDYKGAINKYDQAIQEETDPEKKAGYMFSKASIQFRKLKDYNKARQTAREAAKMRPNWGRPYMLIGDMYATGARNCGNSWNQRLAILAAMDKYNYAKSIDPSVADEASEKTSKYRTSMPSKEDGFMQGFKSGDSTKVGCWIGENVKIRYNS